MTRRRCHPGGSISLQQPLAAMSAHKSRHLSQQHTRRMTMCLELRWELHSRAAKRCAVTQETSGNEENVGIGGCSLHKCSPSNSNNTHKAPPLRQLTNFRKGLPEPPQLAVQSTDPRAWQCCCTRWRSQ